MDYLIKVEVVGDFGLRAIAYMDDSDSVHLSGAESLMDSKEIQHAAMLVEVAQEQLAILRAAETVEV
jgi:hypothetical protein